MKINVHGTRVIFLFREHFYFQTKIAHAPFTINYDLPNQSSERLKLIQDKPLVKATRNNINEYFISMEKVYNIFFWFSFLVKKINKKNKRMRYTVGKITEG